MDMDYLSSLPVDLVFQLLTYLPFDDVIKLCRLNRKFHFIGTNYKNKWNQLIDNTYRDIYNYQDKINTIRSKLNIDGDTYNYLVYTKLINSVDPITQLMIYYRQDDMKSFNNEKYNTTQRSLAMLILGRHDELLTYRHFGLLCLDFLSGNCDQTILNGILQEMLNNGNVKGTQMVLEHGAQIHENSLDTAIYRGRLNVVKYIIETQNVKITTVMSRLAGKHIEILKYMIKHGIDRNQALEYAKMYNNSEVIDYLNRLCNKIILIS